MVLVIDALDEACDDSKATGEAVRKELLAVLSSAAANLPSDLRILVTSRPEDDIATALHQPHVRRRVLGDSPKDSTEADIRTYIQSELAKHADELDSEWPNGQWLDELVIRSGNLFQWASTACKQIHGKPGSTPIDGFRTVLHSKHNGLHGLYFTILDRTFVFSDDDDPRVIRFRMVIGRILDARRPFLRETLRLLGTGDGRDVDPIISYLGALFKGVSSEVEPIRPLHASLRDFFFDEKSSGLYFVRPRSQDESLALACLRVMRTDLKFNMCSLKMSYYANFNRSHSDVTQRNESNMATAVEQPLKSTKGVASTSTAAWQKTGRFAEEARLQDGIPDHLSYACHFWADHLNTVPENDNPGVSGAIKHFLQSALLFWAEAMGLTEAVGLAMAQARSLLHLANVRTVNAISFSHSDS
jgi:hypothetical protein